MQERISSILSVFLVLTTDVRAVEIGSFNLQQYGSTKAADTRVTGFIADLINDFDLAVIQEITDTSQRAPYVLLGALNQRSPLRPYTMTLSERVGRSSSKEQYIFFNRESTSGVKLINSYLYDDVANRFERPPFIGTFEVTRVSSSNAKYFTIMNVHLRPLSAYEELLAIRYVIKDFILKNPRYFGQTSASLNEAVAQNVIGATANHKPSLKSSHPILIMGDFNADCRYLSNSQQESLRSIDYADFVWMISNEIKTNTRQTCTYDRILINGNNFVRAIVPRSNTTINFQKRFGMTLEQALKISDHFPIKFDIDW